MKLIKCIMSFLLFFKCFSIENTSVYLDYAASASVNEEALDMLIAVSRLDGNSSGMNAHSWVLRKIEEESAKIIAGKLDAKTEQIVFTPSATMSNNIAILGVALKYPKCHLITSKIEHKSVLNIFKHLESKGYSVTYLNVDKYGNIDLDQLDRSIRKDTRLISIQMVNSEIGTIQNLERIGLLAKKRKVIFHSDAAQAFGKYSINVDKFGLDMATISGYKIGSPKGIAALYVRNESKLQPILFGSGNNLFPGTKPTALMASFAKAALEYKFDAAKIKRNYEALVSELKKIDKVFINSSNPSHIVSVSIENVLLKDVLDRMKEYSFSSGCSCSGQEQSNVIQAIDPAGKLPQCTLRISFSDNTTPSTLVDFSTKLRITVNQLREEKSITNGCESQNNSNGILNVREIRYFKDQKMTLDDQNNS